MRSQYLGVPLIVGLLFLLGCETLGEGEFVGVIANASSHTLYVEDPLDDTKEFRLKPGEQTKRYALDEGRHTFSASYASDRTSYASVSVNINGVKQDAYYDGLNYDWAVVFTDPNFFSRVEYQP